MLTVLIASHNGAGRLPETLAAFARLEPPAGGWCMVVIDSASTDATFDVVQQYRDRLPLRCIRHIRRGKNAALNVGLDHVQGDLVVFSDDDVVPERDWLVQLRNAADWRPDYAVFGGAILPLWPGVPDSWITRVVPLGPVYSLTDPEQAEGPLGWWLVWGPNMMVRARIFASGARFDESVGPDGTATYRMGSEISFTEMLAQQGHRFWHVSGARVQHVIRPRQLEPAWILGRAFRHGRGTVSARKSATEAPRWFGVPRWVVRAALSALLQSAGALLRGNRDEAFRRAWEMQVAIGVGYEQRRNWTSRRLQVLVSKRTAAVALLFHVF